MPNGVFSIPLAGQPERLSDLLRDCVAPLSLRLAKAGGVQPAAAGDEVYANLAFDEFIAGPENQPLLTAIGHLMGNNRRWPRQLVLYGPTGVGKTHLAHGALRFFREQERAERDAMAAHGEQPVAKRRKALLVRAADMARDFGEAIETRSVAAWRKNYLAVELLIVEDLAQLAEKPPVQEELCGILDYLQQREGRALLTAPALPKSMNELSPRLRSRLTAGHVLPVAPPSEETRVGMLEQLVAKRNTAIEPQALADLAGHRWATFGALRGALLTLEFHSGGHAITAADVATLLTEQQRDSEAALATIATLAAKHFGLTVGELRGPSRRRGTAAARQVAMLLARETTGQSMVAIGRYFGRRDHTTVLHSCRKAAAASEPTIRAALAQLRTLLNGSALTAPQAISR